MLHKYSSTGIYITQPGLPGGESITDFRSWKQFGALSKEVSTVKSLLYDGLAEETDGGIFILYPTVKDLSIPERKALGLPDDYPFELFVSYEGGSLAGNNTVYTYRFQKEGGPLGAGIYVANPDDRINAYIRTKFGDYILTADQLELVNLIDRINKTPWGRSERERNIAEVVTAARNAKAIIAQELTGTEYVLLDKVGVAIEPAGDDQFKLVPTVEGPEKDKFSDLFDASDRVKTAYTHRSKGGNTRIIVKKEGEAGEALNDSLAKLKKQRFTVEELNEVAVNPSQFFDTEVIDLELFSDRVVELGLYQPRFYPFVSPVKSDWVPGVKIEDVRNGDTYLTVSSSSELIDLQKALVRAKEKGGKVQWKEHELPVNVAEELLELATKQLAQPNEPVIEKVGKGERKKVLIIKENIESLEFEVETAGLLPDEFPFYSVKGLREGIKLKDHQTTGISWLQATLNSPEVTGVLLGDDMGLGKTLQVLYTIEYYALKNKKPILIIAPVSLLQNWENELNFFFPKSRLLINRVWSSGAKQYIVKGQPSMSKRAMSYPGIYLTTYETLRHKQVHFATVDWGLVIADEIQKIKTPGTMVTNSAKALKADFKIGMTGTPVENSLMDLWCIMDFCCPGLLKDAKSFEGKYISPQKDSEDGVKMAGDSLRKKIGRYLIRRLKSDVAKDLPDISHQVLPVAMPEVQFTAYAGRINKALEDKENGHTKQGSFELLFAIRDISDHPYLKNAEQESIPVEVLVSASAKLSKTVAILRQVFTQKEKCIIFTENRRMQSMLQRVVESLFEYSPAIVNGTTPSTSTARSKKMSRQDYIDEFQKEDGFGVIIMSPIAAGFGLNVTAANHVIHYTRHWNPAKEQQATDRAHRIGQQRPVTVYYPIAVIPEDKFRSFDLVLNDLLERKKNLAKHTLFPSETIKLAEDDFKEIMQINGAE